jgi:hypothetical protein
MRLLQLALLLTVSHAFHVMIRPATRVLRNAPIPTARATRLYETTADEGAAEEAATAAEAEVVSEDEEEVTAEAEEEEEEEEPKEDPELAKLKKNIATMEQKLKEARRLSASTGDRADEYTKDGYARKVAGTFFFLLESD